MTHYSALAIEIGWVQTITGMQYQIVVQWNMKRRRALDVDWAFWPPRSFRLGGRWFGPQPRYLG